MFYLLHSNFRIEGPLFLVVKVIVHIRSNVGKFSAIPEVANPQADPKEMCMKKGGEDLEL